MQYFYFKDPNSDEYKIKAIVLISKYRCDPNI